MAEANEAERQPEKTKENNVVERKENSNYRIRKIIYEFPLINQLKSTLAIQTHRIHSIDSHLYSERKEKHRKIEKPPTM